MAEQQSSELNWQPRLSEQAVLGGARFDLVKAKEIMKATPHPVENKPLGTFKPAYYLLDIKVDWEKAKLSDLKFPVIAAVLDGRPTIIDGWHRYAYALRQAMTEIPVVTLSEAEVGLVRK